MSSSHPRGTTALAEHLVKSIRLIDESVSGGRKKLPWDANDGGRKKKVWTKSGHYWDALVV